MKPLVTGGTRQDAEWETQCLAPFSLLAILALGRALQISDGSLEPAAIGWVTVGFLLIGIGLTQTCFLRWHPSLLPALASVGLAVQVLQLLTKPPGFYLQLQQGGDALFYRGALALGVVGAAAIWTRRLWVRSFLMAGLVGIHFAAGAWIIRSSPDPSIDVFVFQRDAIAALRSGIEPYGLTFPNIYGYTTLYGSGLSVEGRLQFGFPYFPLSLLLALPGQLFAGDHRYAQLVAIELAAILMTAARSTGFGAVAAVLFLTTPRGFFVLEQSWTEPLVVVGLAAVVFAACRRQQAVPWLFGAFVALKQYLVFALPAAWLLVARPSWRDVRDLLVKAAVVGAVVTLPFLLWNPHGFWRSVVFLHFHQPFRPDSLSYLAWWAAHGHQQLSALVAFVAAGVVSTLAVWRLPRTAAGFGAAISVTFFAFFVFNKQAFCNYYFFVIGALAVTLSACGRGSDVHPYAPDADYSARSRLRFLESPNTKSTLGVLSGTMNLKRDQANQQLVRRQCQLP